MTDVNKKIKADVERFAASHDSMRLPADWLKYIPCRYEVYCVSSTDSGERVANVLLYHEKGTKR